MAFLERSGAEPRRERAVFFAFVGLVTAEVAYIFLFAPFPTVDMATHLASAQTLARVAGGEIAAETGLLEWTPVAAPNLLPHLALAVFVEFAGPVWAERFILAGYVVLFSAATCWALCQTRRASIVLAVFALPLTFNRPFLWGFLNFCYSIAAFMWIAGMLMRWKAQLDARRTVVLAGALMLAFLTHFVGYLEAALFAVCVLGVGAVAGPNRLVAFAYAAVALAPAGLLAMAFVFESQTTPVLAPIDVVRRGQELVSLIGAIAAYDPLERIACVAVALALLTLVMRALVGNPRDVLTNPLSAGLALFGVTSSLVALFGPDEAASGGSLASIRYPLFPVLGLLLWLGYQSIPRRVLMTAALLPVAAAVTLAAVRHDELRAVEAAVQDLAKLAPCVRRGSTLVQANIKSVRFGSRAGLDPLTAEVGRLAAARASLDLGNSDLTMPFGILRFRPDKNPAVHLVQGSNGFFAIESVPPPLHLESFERQTGVNVDYVVVFGRELPDGAHIPLWATQGQSVEREMRTFEDELHDRYELVSSSPQRIWELWGRQSVTAAPPADSIADEHRACG